MLHESTIYLKWKLWIQVFHSLCTQVLLTLSLQLALSYLCSKQYSYSLKGECTVQRWEWGSKSGCWQFPSDRAQTAVLPLNILFVRKVATTIISGWWVALIQSVFETWFLMESQNLKTVIASLLWEKLQVSFSQSFKNCSSKGIPRHCIYHDGCHGILFQQDNFFLICS